MPLLREPDQTVAVSEGLASRVIPRGATLGESHQIFWVEQTYATYDENVKWWNLLDDMREAGDTFVRGKHLTPLRTEIDHKTGALKPSYYRRLAGSTRLPLTNVIVDPLTGFLAAHPPSHSAEAEDALASREPLAVTVERSDPTRERSLTMMSVDLSEMLWWYGIGWRVADTDLVRVETPSEGVVWSIHDSPGTEPLVTGTPTTDPSILVNNFGDLALPYTYNVHPSRVTQARWDTRGNLTHVVMIDEMDVGGDDLEPTKVYRWWSLDMWGVYVVVRLENGQRELRTIEEGERSGPIPVWAVKYKEHRDRMRGIGLVEYWALLDRAHYNLLTSIGAKLADASSTQRYVAGKFAALDEMPDARENASVEALRAAVAMLSDEVMGFDGDNLTVGTLQNSYGDLSIAVDYAEKLQEWALAMSGRPGATSSGMPPESGIAQLTRFQYVNAILARTATIIEASEYKVIAEWSRQLMVEPPPRSARRWQRRFDVRTVPDLLTLRQGLDGLTSSQVLNKASTEIVEKVWGEIEPSELAELVASAKAWPSTSATAIVGPDGMPAPTVEDESIVNTTKL